MTNLATYMQGGAPGSAYWNQVMTPQNLLGLNPGTGSKAAGSSLPPTSVAGGDNAYVPWSPDSPMFWFVVIAGATVIGIAGASVKVRAFKRHASVDIGNV